MPDPDVPAYDNFVSFCANEYSSKPSDFALKYFDNRFFNRRHVNQTGHLRQAFYAADEFFRRHPAAVRNIQNYVEDGRLDFQGWPYHALWIKFLEKHNQIHLPAGGDMETVYKILPASLGGNVEGGGGAGPSFKVVIPLVARYVSIAHLGLGIYPPLGADQFSDIEDPVTLPARRKSVISRIIRDTKKSLSLKSVHDFKCQVCKKRIEFQRSVFYAEGHHLQPLGGRHKGPDSKPNLLVLCPWHHAEFDHFLFHIDPATLRLIHRLRTLEPHESQLRIATGHAVGTEFLEYNNSFFNKLVVHEAQH